MLGILASVHMLAPPSAMLRSARCWIALGRYTLKRVLGRLPPAGHAEPHHAPARFPVARSMTALPGEVAAVSASPRTSRVRGARGSDPDPAVILPRTQRS